MKKPFIFGYHIKKDELILPIETYEEAGYDVVEDGDCWIIGAINESVIRNISKYVNRVHPWQFFSSFKSKELDDDNLW